MVSPDLFIDIFEISIKNEILYDSAYFHYLNIYNLRHICKKVRITHGFAILLNFHFRPRAEYIPFPSVWIGLTEYRWKYSVYVGAIIESDAQKCKSKKGDSVSVVLSLFNYIVQVDKFD